MENNTNNENKKILSSTAEIFTLSMIFISIFNFILRGNSEEISKLSELFVLCGQGITFKALAELLFMAVVISLMRYLWFSDKFFKNMMMFHRITFMLISVFVLSATFSAVFRWFPFNMWQAWTGFIISFVISTLISYGAMLLRSKMESRKYQQVFNEYKNKEENRDERN